MLWLITMRLRFSITSWCSWNKKLIKRLPKQWRRKLTMATSIYLMYILLCSLICSWMQYMRLLFINTLMRLIFTEINFSQINFRRFCGLLVNPWNCLHKIFPILLSAKINVCKTFVEFVFLAQFRFKINHSALCLIPTIVNNE